jgi:hypothetical protein
VYTNDVAMLNTQVVSHNSIDSGTPIIEVIIGKNNQHRVLAFLAFDKYSIATEKLERLHRVV